MASLFGGRNARANTPSISLPTLALSVQTSVQGRARAIGWGTAILAGNIIDLQDFRPDYRANNAPSPASGAGKGGIVRGPQAAAASGEWVYYATVLTSLCEGPITSVNAFTGDGLTLSTYGGGTGGATLFLGTQTQVASGFMTANHPANALAYRGEAYLLHNPMFLGTNTTVPNFQYEITFGIHGVGADFPLDANPRDVAVDFTSNTQYGVAGFPASLVASMDNYAAWCRANGLLVSPVLTDQVEAAQFLISLAQATYAEPKWSGGVLDIVPYGEFAITAHGATYTPPNGGAPDYVLTPDDFLTLQGGDTQANGSNVPIATKRKDPQKLVNNVRIEYLDRSAGYIPNEIDHKDEASIASTRERPSDVRQNHFFKLATAAAASAAFQLQRERVGNEYYFTLPKHFVLIDLMDLVELPLDHWGESDAPQVVRIKEITENQDRSFTFRAEDYDGAVLPPLYARQTNTHSIPDFNADPGPINVPLLFELPASADPTASTAMLYAAVSGGANFGGADVYAATDGVNYTLVDKVKGNARMGVTTSVLPAIGVGSSDLPDIANTLGVDLSESRGVLGSGTVSDMLARATLCYVGGELIAYDLATLTSTYHYSLAPLLRGAYGSPISTHASGVPFCRVDGNVARVPFEKARAGTLVYLKFVPFNTYGGGQTTLADATAYTYRLAGTALDSDAVSTPTDDNAFAADFVGAVNDFRNAVTATRAAAVAQAGVAGAQSTLTGLATAFANLVQRTFASLGDQSAAALLEQTSRVTGDFASANTTLGVAAVSGAADFDASAADFVNAVNSAARDRTNFRSTAVALAGAQQSNDALTTLLGSFAQAQSTVFAQFGQMSARVQTTETTLANAAGSYASLTLRLNANDTAVSTDTTAITSAAGSFASMSARLNAGDVTVSSNTTAISTINSNLSGSWNVTIDINGKVTGVSLYGSGTGSSSFDVRADKFNVWATGLSNTPVFSVSTIGGVAGVTINGAYLGDLSALNSALGNNSVSHGARQVGSSGLSGTISVSARAGARLRAIAYWAGSVTNVSNTPTITAPGQVRITLDGVQSTFPGAYVYDGGTNTFTFLSHVGIASMVNGGTARTISASGEVFYTNTGGNVSLPVNVTIELDEISK